MAFWDVLRWLVLAEASLIFFATLRIVVVYVAVWRRAPQRLRLLPLHVALLGLGTNIFAFDEVHDITVKLGDEPSWFALGTALPALTCVLVGMALIHRHLIRKRHGLPEIILEPK